MVKFNLFYFYKIFIISKMPESNSSRIQIFGNVDRSLDQSISENKLAKDLFSANKHKRKVNGPRATGAESSPHAIIFFINQTCPRISLQNTNILRHSITPRI